MLQEIAFSAREAMAVGTSFYLGALFFGVVMILLRKPYPRAVMFALLAAGLPLNFASAILTTLRFYSPFGSVTSSK